MTKQPKFVYVCWNKFDNKTNEILWTTSYPIIIFDTRL